MPQGTADDQPSASTQLAFAMAVDEGRVDELPEWQRAAAGVLAAVNNTLRREANALGGNVGFIEHYFAREWVQPGKVREYIVRALYGKRPLQGRGGFKKARARKENGDIFTFREMLQAGFEPVSYNPVEAHLRKWTEMNKWIAARRILREGRGYNLATPVLSGQTPPEGWVRYPDSFGTIWGPPTVKVSEAYDAGLMEALHRFATAHGITMVRRVNMGGANRWGYVVKGLKTVHSRFGGPEGVLMHEIGHILDNHYGLGDAIGLAQASERTEEKNFGETPSKVLAELRALADLRLERGASAHQKAYVRERPEQIANLVHAFLYAPDLAKQVAPNAYHALYSLAKDHDDLAGLLDIQRARSLRFGVNQAEIPVGGRVISGYYYGPPDAVRLLENHLSPGLRGHATYDLYRKVGNTLNQVQLGLSGFHVVGTALNSVFSKFALALEHGSRGQAGAALRALAETPVAPIIDIVRGHKILKAFYERDATFRELVHEADIVAKAGGGVGWDNFWHESAPERFMAALRSMVAEGGAGHPIKALGQGGLALMRAVPAAIELQAKPVMQWWVPRLKLAAFMDLARMELADLGERPHDLDAARVLGNAWDSVDNRFGELIYDNIFWHAILKDAGMASVRALGWNIGTVREVFGAPGAQLRQLGLMPGGGFGKPPTRHRHTGFGEGPDGTQAPTYVEGREPALTHKFAYLVSLLFLSALFGAIYQYGHTGLRPGEQEDGSTDLATVLLDLYFPRTGGRTSTGRAERASLPTYMKDVYAFSRHSVTTIEHKLNPLLALIADLVRNEDYFGNEIRNDDDPLVRQLRDVFSYMEEQYRPISVRSFEQRKTDTKTGVNAVESFGGIGVAPASVTRTALEEYLHDITPPAHRSKEQAEQAAERRAVREAARTPPGQSRPTVDTSHLSSKSVKAATQSAYRSYLASAIARSDVSMREAIKAYTLASPEERLEIRAAVSKKLPSALASTPVSERAALMTTYRDAMTLPVGKRAAGF